MEVSNPCVGQIGAGRVGDEQIPVPAIPKNVQDITLKVRTGCLGWQQITRPRVMTLFEKGIPHNAAEFTRDKNAHQQ